MTQHEAIRQYIEDFGSISPMEAFRDLGITKLATRISEMKRKGEEFKQKEDVILNRYGKQVRFMRYFKK